MSKHRHILIAFAVAATIAVSASRSHAIPGSVTSYSHSFYGQHINHGTGVGSDPPIWHAAADQNAEGVASVEISDDLVFYAAQNRIVAASLATGDHKWSVAARSVPGGPSPVLVYAGGVLYAASPDGSIRALVAASGNVRFDIDPEAGGGIRADVVGIAASGGVLLVTRIGSVAAYDLKSGKRRWVALLPQSSAGGQPAHVGGNTVLRSYGQTGADAGPRVDAYDRETGKRLWTTTGVWLGENATTVYVWETAQSSDPPTGTFRSLALDTGLIVTEATFPIAASSGDPIFRPHVAVGDGRLFIWGKGVVNSYKINYLTNPAARLWYMAPIAGEWIAGPYHGTVVYSTSRSEGLATTDMRTRALHPLIPTTRHIQRIDILHGWILAGLAEGEVDVFGASSAKRYLRASVKSASFGEFHATGNYVVVSEQKEVAVYRVGGLR